MRSLSITESVFKIFFACGALKRASPRIGYPDRPHHTRRARPPVGTPGSRGGDGGSRGGMYDGAGRGQLENEVIGGDQGVRGAEGRVPWASSRHSASDGTKNRVAS